jgi:hypothetical protein
MRSTPWRHAVAKGAEPYEGADKTIDWPAIKGIGGSLIYFTDGYWDASPYNAEFDWVADAHPAGVGFYYLDHLTHNVFRGNMDTWFRFYGDLFNFREIRFFDIEGKYSGLFSRALTSPCGRIRIPINEDRGETGQIVNYLKKYNGEGIQHIAVGARNIYDAVDAIAERGIRFMPGPPETYYAQSFERVTGHSEPVERMKRHGDPDRRRGGRGRGGDEDPVADLLQDRDRADLLRVHRAQGRRRLRRGQLQGAVRIDRGRGGGAGRLRGRGGRIGRAPAVAGGAKGLRRLLPAP